MLGHGWTFVLVLYGYCTCNVLRYRISQMLQKCTGCVLDEHVLGCLRHSLTWGDAGRM